MNAGLEDVRVLFSILDAASSSDPAETMEDALAVYSRNRTPDASAINDLALKNYTEMRSSVTSPIYLVRKHMEEWLSVYVPSLGWATKYSRVSFGNERYSEVVRKSESQGKLLIRGLVGFLTGPIVIGGIMAWYRWRQALPQTRGLFDFQKLFGWKTS